MTLHEIDSLLERIRALVVELGQLEGDGADGAALAIRRRELDQLKSLLANVVSHDPEHDYSAAA